MLTSTIVLLKIRSGHDKNVRNVIKNSAGVDKYVKE